MENTYHYRHFLICNKIANNMQTIEPQNYALLLVEEFIGKWGNNQMTKYFVMADRTISELVGIEESSIWDELDMDIIAKLSVEEIEFDYQRFCCGQLSIEFND